MEWFWALIGAPLLDGVLGAFPGLLGEHLRQRGAIREHREQAMLSELAEERRSAAQLAAAEQQYQHQILIEKYKNQTERYPLGVIGRLRDLAAVDDIRPAVLVSPMTGWAAAAPSLIHQALYDLGDFATFAQLYTGAFVSDGGVTRTIAGSVEAREIGMLEFPGQPAILVYFEDNGSRVNAFAHLGSLFPLSDGRTGFGMRIASFGSGGGSTPMSEGSLPVWRYVNLDEVDRPPAEVIAAVVAWFVATCVEIYWALQGVSSLNLRRNPVARFAVAPASESPLLGAAVSLIDRINEVESVFGCRMQQEVTTLLRLGYTDIETVEYGPERVALVVSNTAMSMSFLLDADFPASPPGIFYITDSEREHIVLDGSTWSPEHTLAEIAEAIG
ncbi:hypothetical protein V7968_32660 [Nocardia vulneris]|uniref:hypothetical protein n=1 Tax=Nocardia vulneris TaxID=1141657 RepID=UPI0030CC9155